MKTVTGRVPRIPGFRVSGIACGIKKKGVRDLALIVSDTPTVAAGVFTTNQVRSPSVGWNERALRQAPSARAILVNSGNANSCTGRRGHEDCKQLTRRVAEELGVAHTDVLIASTGIIGKPLPLQVMLKGIPSLTRSLSPTGWDETAEAIMTTDLVSKSASVSYFQGKKKIMIGGITKGSGMIHPNMATMLAFLTTNAAINPRTLRRALKEASDQSFNRITVDGDCSTNDMVLVLANGHAENPPIRTGTAGYKQFVKALVAVCRNLAFQIVKDGEGATKFVTVRVQKARSRPQAHQIANSVATSALVKTALFGEDPNWGRILCAAGYAGPSFNPDRLKITLNGKVLFRNGVPARGASESVLRRTMKRKEITIVLDLNAGSASDEVYTCDFSYDYVRINAEYTT